MECPFCSGELFLECEDWSGYDEYVKDYKCDNCGRIVQEIYRVELEDTVEVDEDGNELHKIV